MEPVTNKEPQTANTTVINSEQAPVAPPPTTPPSGSPTPQGSAPKASTPINNLKDKFNSFPKNTKILVIAVIVLFLIIFVLSMLTALFGKKRTGPIATPSPTPISETPQPEIILNASRYATDEGVLKIEKDLKDIRKQLDDSDVKQTDLSIPSLDFNINFNQ